MLVGVGCKNYDDDINKMQEDINNIKGDVVKLNSLEARIKAVEATAEEFKKINFSDYVKNADLTTKLTQIQNEFTNKLAGYATSKDLNDAKSALQALINAKTTLDEVKALLADYAKKADVYDKAKIDQLLKDQYAKIIENTDNWLGEHFADYMKEYITSEDFKNAAAGAASASILEKLNAANAEYVAALNAALNSIEGDEAIIREKDVKALREEVAKYKDEIANLWTAIGKLASRIQSLVFVPTTTAGTIVFSAQFIENSGEQIDLTTDLKQVVTFRVTPASLADGLVKAWEDGTVTMNFQEEKLTKAESLVEIEDVTAGENGKINLVISSAYEFDTNKKLAIALNIADVPEDDGLQGIEFSSAYVVAEGAAAGTGNIFSNLKLAQKNAAGEYVEITSVNELTLAYTATKALELQKDIELVYTPATDVYYNMADAAEMFNWDVMPELKFENGVFTPAVNQWADGAYTITPAKPEEAKTTPVTVAIKDSKKAVIGNNGELTTKYTIVAEGAEDVVELIAAFKTKVTIAKEDLSEVQNADAAIVWNYKEYAKTNNEYKVKTAALSGITTKLFNELNWSGATWTVEDLAGAETKLKTNNAITVAAAAGSTPSVEGDAKMIEYTVKNYYNGNGSIKVSATVPTTDATQQVKISGTITFTGLADMTYDITNANAEFTLSSGNATATITDGFVTKLWKSLPAGQKNFADSADLKTFVKALTQEYSTQAADANNANIVEAEQQDLTYTAASGAASTATVLFKAVDFSKYASYTYTVTAKDNSMLWIGTSADDNYFKIAVTGTVTIDKNKMYYLKSQSGLYPEAGTDGYMLSIASVKPDDATDKVDRAVTFAMSKVELKNGYVAQAPEGATAVVTYAVSTAPANWPNDAKWPDSTTSEGIIDWDGSGADKVEVVYTMKVGDVVMDTKTIEVRVQKMIDFSKFTYTTNTTVQADVQGVDNKLNVFSLMKDIKDTQTTPNKLIFTPAKPADVLTTAPYQWINALNQSVPTTYGLVIELGDAEYSVGNERFKFDTVTGVFTVEGRTDALATDVTVTIPVTYTYQYAWSPVTNDDGDITGYEKTKFTANLTFKVLKSKIVTNNKR